MDPEEAAALLAETEPEVMSVALTGPTHEVAAVVRVAGPLSTCSRSTSTGAPLTCG